MRLPVHAARIAAWSGAIALLAAGFLAYRSPALVVDLANRVWSCF